MHFIKYTIRSSIWSSCNVVILTSDNPVILVILIFVPKLLTD